MILRNGALSTVLAQAHKRSDRLLLIVDQFDENCSDLWTPHGNGMLS